MPKFLRTVSELRAERDRSWLLAKSPAVTGRAPPLGRSWGGSGTATPARTTLSSDRLGAQARGGVDPLRRSARFRLHLHPAPRGPRVGGRNFPERGLPCPELAVRPFLFTERKGKWKRRGGGWRLLRRPRAGSDVESQGPAAHARVLRLPIAWAPLRRPPSGRPHACVPQAGHPLPSEPELWAGTRNTQVTGFGVPSVCFGGVPPGCPGRGSVPTLKRSVPPTGRHSGGPLHAGTAGKHLAQGRGEVWTRGSSPFLLLPGSRVTSQCRPGLWWGTRAPALSASPAGDAAWTAALLLLSLGECNLEAEGPRYGRSVIGLLLP